MVKPWHVKPGKALLEVVFIQIGLSWGVIPATPTVMKQQSNVSYCLMCSHYYFIWFALVNPVTHCFEIYLQINTSDWKSQGQNVSYAGGSRWHGGHTEFCCCVLEWWRRKGSQLWGQHSATTPAEPVRCSCCHVQNWVCILLTSCGITCRGAFPLYWYLCTGDTGDWT